MRVAVVGAGAVGGYFGGRLAQAGEEVVFLARGAHLRALQSDGLRVASVAGDFEVRPARTTDDPRSVGPVDVILLGVKSWQVSLAAGTLRPLLGEDTFVVPLQNGIEAPARLVEVLGPEPVVGGLCRILSRVAAPGRIEHTGIDPYVAFGELSAGPSPRTERLRTAFARASGVTAETPEDIRVAMWRKFLLITAWSAVGGLTRAPVGVIRNQPETRRLLTQALEEIVAVAAAHGVALDGEDLRRTLKFLDDAPPGGTTSMQRDMMEGRPSELDGQLGAVVRLGRQAGVQVPLHEMIYGGLLPLELRARGELAFPER